MLVATALEARASIPEWLVIISTSRLLPALQHIPLWIVFKNYLNLAFGVLLCPRSRAQLSRARAGHMEVKRTSAFARLAADVDGILLKGGGELVFQRIEFGSFLVRRQAVLPWMQQRNVDREVIVHQHVVYPFYRKINHRDDLVTVSRLELHDCKPLSCCSSPERVHGSGHGFDGLAVGKRIRRSRDFADPSFNA